MDGEEARSAAPDDEPSVLGSLPTSRPQHRSTRRGGTAKKVAAPTRPSSRAPRRRAASASPPAEPRTEHAPPVDDAPQPPPAPSVPAPPPAPRSGWATPEPAPAPSTLPPLPAIVDGAVRTGAGLVRGVLRRLPFG